MKTPEEILNEIAAENMLNIQQMATTKQLAIAAMRRYAKEYHESKVKTLALPVVISCFLKEAAKNNKDYSKITIQMRDNELQVQGHKPIPYGQSWGKWLIEESRILNNL